MSACPVAIHFDPGEFGFSDCFQVGPGSGVDEFLLVAGEEALSHSVVVADAGPAERAPDSVRCAECVERFRRVLGAAVE